MRIARKKTGPSTKLATALALYAVAAIARADPALPWPGFIIDAVQPPSMVAQRAADPQQAAAKHLYTFGVPYRWLGKLVWNYNDQGRPPSLTLDEAVAGIAAAAKRWTDVCAVQIERGPDSAAIPQTMDGGNESPGANVIGWGDLALGAAGNPNLAAVTWSYSGTQATLIGFDMTLSTTYIQDVDQLAHAALHEWGHALGLAHSNVPDAVMAGPASRSNPAAPATPYNALAELTDDDKHGCMCLYGAGEATAGQGYLCGLPAAVVIDAVALGTTSAPYPVTLTNASGTSALTITDIDTGSPEIFKDDRCSNGTTLAAGESCTFHLVFRPGGTAGQRAETFVHIATSNGVGEYSFPVTASAAPGGAGGAPAAPLVPSAPVAQLAPPTIAFGAVSPGMVSAAASTALFNAGGGTLTLMAVTPLNADAADFLRGGNCTPGTALVAGASCTLAFQFAPAGPGARTALISLLTSAGTVTLTLNGSTTRSALEPVDVVEYYNASLDHYFITASPAEIAIVDAGGVGPWQRTGYTFKTWATPVAGTSPVCRYYIPPSHGNSHFYSALPEECNAIPSRFPAFEHEGDDVMNMALPDVATGACPAETLPLYRLWNQRGDSNHRYTTDRWVRDAMLARGYVAEGFGADPVAMCAPR